MLSSAANLFLASMAFVTVQGQSQIQPRTDSPAPQIQIMNSVGRSLATIRTTQGQVTGLAVLIDSRGIFLAHEVVAPNESMLGTLEGKSLKFKLLAKDEQTQLVALQALDWKGPQTPIVRVAKSELKNGETFLAATVQGPMQSELVTSNRAGVMKPSLRYTPLQEIKLERSMDAVGGALVFNRIGELVGVLGATLEPVTIAKIVPGKPDSNKQVSQGYAQRNSNFGPQGMTVGYALGPKLLTRVVAGFRSDSHQVEHPSIGAFFRSGARAGALIHLVKENSPAEKAGLLTGDLVIEANGKPIKSPVDFAVMLFDLEVGQDLELKVIRADKPITLNVTVGVQTLL